MSNSSSLIDGKKTVGETTICSLGGGGGPKYLIGAFLRPFMPEKRRRKQSNFHQNRRSTLHSRKSFFSRKISNTPPGGCSHLKESKSHQNNTVQVSKSVLAVPSTRSVGVGTDSQPFLNGKGGHDEKHQSANDAPPEIKTKELKEEEPNDKSEKPSSPDKVSVDTHLNVLREKDLQIIDLKKDQAKLFRVVEFYKEKREKALKQRDQAYNGIKILKQKYEQAVTEKEEATEKIISMEGLMKLEQEGSALRELEMKVAELKCQLAESEQEKDDIIDDYETQIEDLKCTLETMRTAPGATKKLASRDVNTV